MSIDLNAPLPKLIAMRGKPEDRTFAKTYALMRARRAAMPQDALAGFRPRRMSDGPIRGLNLPPVTPEPEILKPLACGGIDGIDGDPEEPEITIPEVCQPFVPIEAGQDDPELPIEADEEFESDGGEQEAQGEVSGEQL